MTGVKDLSLDELEALIDARLRDLVKSECIKELEGAKTSKITPPEVEPEMNEEPEKVRNHTEAARKKEKQEEKVEWCSLNDNTYSLMYLCPFLSQGFWYSLFVYALQMTIILLTLIDTIDTEAVKNPLAIPPMVSLPVTCAQGITLLMLAAWMFDLIEAVVKLQDGFFPELLKEHPGATFSTWLVSCLAQLLAGLSLLTGTFILTMQADTVFKVMLNIKTLIFMALIDDLNFGMAKKVLSQISSKPNQRQFLM